MAKKVLSIVIGAEITKVCEVTYKKNYKDRGIRVYKSISFPTPEDTIEDGFIKNKAEFGKQLKLQLKSAKIKTKRVIFSIASSKIANREVIIPLVKDNRIPDIIQTGSAEYFPVDIKDYILSYIILEKKTSDRKERVLAKKQARLANTLEKKQKKLEKKAFKKNKSKHPAAEEAVEVTYKLKFAEDSQIQDSEAEMIEEKTEKKKKKRDKHIRLSVYAVPSNLVKNYYNFADICGLNLVSIDYSGNSSYQMLKRQVKEGTNIFVQLNEQNTVISVLQGNVLVLQRTIGYGISTLIETVTEQSCLGVKNDAEAMKLLENTNLLQMKAREGTPNTAEPSQEAAAAIEYAQAAELLRSDEEYAAKQNIIDSLLFLTNSISRMLDYYKNNHRNTVFQTIYLSGFGIRIQGIDQLFSERIGIDNRKLEKLSTVSANKKAKEYLSNPSEFMACIGSVIKPVDFVPTELVERKQKVQLIIAAAFLILLSIGGSSVLCYVSYQDYLSAQEENRQLTDQLNTLPDTSAVREEHEKASKRVEDLKKMEDSMQSEDKITEVMSDLEKNMLTNAKIQTIEFSDAGIVMNIIMADNNYGANTLVAKLLSQLKNIALFSEVQDSNMSVSDDGEVSLTISCTYK